MQKENRSNFDLNSMVGLIAGATTLLCTMNSVASANGVGCPGGGPPQAIEQRGCYPSDCASLEYVPWGLGGALRTLSVDKFDPALGTLTSIDLRFEARLVGSVCVENDSGACQVFQAVQDFDTSLDPSASNTPQVTGMPPMSLFTSQDLTPNGYPLGPSDGIDECATSTSSPAVGTCNQGDDHFLGAFDLLLVQVLPSLVGADLNPWIANGPGQTVTFVSVANEFLTSIGVSGGSMSRFIQARVELKVTYNFCPANIGTSYCFCTSTAPCGNNAAAGQGCANSTGQGGVLAATGVPSLSSSSLTLHANQLPPNKPGLFFQGNGPEAGGAGSVFGDGLRCVATAIVRLEVTSSDGTGFATTSSDLGALSAASPGDQRFYQLWYRDPNGGPCGSGFNLTNGVQLSWAP